MPVPDDIPDLFPTPAGGDGEIPDLFPAPAAVGPSPEQRRVQLSNKEYDSRFRGGPALTPAETAEFQQQQAPNTAAENHHAQVRQAIRSFLEPDPTLDSYRSQNALYTSATDPVEQGIAAPTQPVISSYHDPRFKNFQTRLGAQLGKTIQADEVSQLLSDQGYGIDQTALERGDAGYDPNFALRAPQQATIGAGKLGANLLDIVGALDPRQATDVQTNPNAFQRAAFDARQGIGTLEGAYAPNRLDSLYQSIAPLLLTLGPAKLAASGATALGAGPGLASATAGAAAGGLMGATSSPEVYRESVGQGMSQAQALGNVGASVGIQAAGMAAGGRLLPFKGLQALAQPEVLQTAQARIVDAVKQAVVGLPAHVAEGAAVMGATTGMDVVRQLLTTNPEMTGDQAVSQVLHSIADGSLFGLAGGGIRGALDVGRSALPPQMADQVGRMSPPETRATDALALPNSFDARVQAARAEVPSGQIPDLLADPTLTNEFLSDVTPTQKFDKNDLRRNQEAVADRPTEQPVVDRQAAPTDTVIANADAAAALPDLFPTKAERPALSGSADRGGSDRSGGSPAARESEIFGRGNQSVGSGTGRPAEVPRSEPTGNGVTRGRTEPTGDIVPLPRSTESSVFGRVAEPAEGAGAGAEPGVSDRGGNAPESVPAGRGVEPAVRPSAVPNREVRPGNEASTARSSEASAQADESATFGGVPDESVGNGPVRLRAGEGAPDGLKRVIERVNKQLDGLPALPDQLTKNPAGSGYGPGNPKYQVPLRPDMTYAEFKKRLDPADAKLLDSAKGNPSAAKKLKERFGWSDQHNEISRPYENFQRNQNRGLAGDLQGGTNKNVGRAHQALNEAGRQNAGSGRGAEARQPEPDQANRARTANAAVPEKVGASTPAPVVEPSRAPVSARVDKANPVGKPAAANEPKSTPVGRDTVTLPRELAKINPRYGYRDQNFQLEFASDLDRAAYTLANKGTKSKAHDQILDVLKRQTGMSEAELISHGQKVRESVKQQAKAGYGGDETTLKVPKLSTSEPAEFSADSFAQAERVDAGSVSPEHQAAIDVAVKLGVNAEVAHLPEHVEGAYNPSTGDVLISSSVPDSDVGRVLGHELTHHAIDELPTELQSQLVRSLRQQLGPAETARLLEAARKKWGAQLGDDALLHEMLADGGGSIVNKRGVSWLTGDRTAWQHVTDWMDRAVDRLRAALGNADAKTRRVIEHVIHEYGKSRSTTHQNGANLAYESNFKGNHQAAIKFAIRDLAKNDERFLASSERKLEKVFGRFGSVGADLSKMGAQIVRRVMSPSYFAGKFPAFADVFSANRTREEHQVRILDRLKQETPTYMGMNETDVKPVNAVLDWQNIHQVDLTDPQLRQRGLDDRQVQAVMEFRQATKSLMDDRRQAIAYSFGKQGSPSVAQVRADAANAANPTEKAKLNLLADLLEKHDQLVRPGYVPRMRFGKFRKLVISDIATGDVLHYDHAENAKEYEQKLAALKQQYAGQLNGPNATLNLDTARVVDRADQESYGFSESDITAMAKAAGVSPKILSDFLSAGVSEHLMAKGFNKHLLPSSNTPGYSTNFQRALASYALSASHGISLIRFNSDIREPMQKMATSDQALHQYASQYKDYMLNRQNDGSWLRNLAFLKYLGFNVGSAVTNLTQVPLVTAPFMYALSGKPHAVVGSWKNALESVAAAFGETAGNAALALKGQNPNLDMIELYADHIQQKNPQLASALRAARANGIMTQADVRAFTAMAQRGGNSTAGKAARGFANAAAYPFAKSERAVRLATFVAAHELATKAPANSTFWRRANDLGFNGQPGDPAALASWVVDETQGIYGKANRPELFRHWSTAPLYIFKQYGQNILTTLYKLSKVGINEAKTGNVVNAPLGAVAAYFAQSLVAGGIWNALPGGQTLKSTINSLRSMHGGKRDIEVELDALLGPTAGEAVNRGGLGFLPGPLGEFGPAIGRRSGLGNIVPPTDDIAAILGPGLGAIRDTANDVNLLTSGDPWAQSTGAADLIAGRTGKGLVDAAKAATSSRGIETQTGKTLIPQKEATATDIGGLALGLPTRHIDEAKRANKQIQDVRAGSGDVLQRLVAQHVDGILGKDQKAVSAAMKALVKHNNEALKSGRTSELINAETYRLAIKAEMAQRQSGVMNNRGIPKKDFLQVQQLRRSSAGYQTADEPSE